MNDTKHLLTIISDSQFSQNIILDHDESVCHSFLVLANEKPTSCTISAQLHGKKSSVDIHIIGFVRNQHLLHIDGGIIIPQTGRQTTGKLLEEVVILGNYSHTLTKPVLDIKNSDVLASHGAKIHRIDETKLFYLSSRGLNETQAKQVIAEGMIHGLFEHNPTVSIIHNNIETSITDTQLYKNTLVKQIISSK